MMMIMIELPLIYAQLSCYLECPSFSFVRGIGVLKCQNFQELTPFAPKNKLLVG